MRQVVLVELRRILCRLERHYSFCGAASSRGTASRLVYSYGAWGEMRLQAMVTGVRRQGMSQERHFVTVPSKQLARTVQGSKR